MALFRLGLIFLVWRGVHGMPHAASGTGCTAVAQTGGYQDPFSNSQQREVLDLSSSGPRLWEILLVNSTQAVSLMAHIVAFSTVKNVDTSMTSYAPTGGWVRVKHPDSLRASLVQLVNELSDTIRVSSNNLDEVQSRLRQVPSNLRMSLRVIRKYKLELIPKFLPVYLGAIEKHGNKCSELVEQTVYRVSNASELIKELQLGVFSTEAGRKEELRLAKIEAEATKALQLKMEEIADFNKKVYANNTKRADKAQKKFYDALNNLPSSWEKLGQDLCKFAGKALLTAGSVYMGGPAAGAAIGATGIAETVRDATQKNSDTGSDGLNQLKKKMELTNDDLLVIGNLENYLDEISGLIKLTDSPQLTAEHQKFKTLLNRLNTIKDLMPSPSGMISKIFQKCSSTVTGLISACSSVSDALKDSNCFGQPTAATSDSEGCKFSSQKGQIKQTLIDAKKSIQTMIAAKGKFSSETFQGPNLSSGESNNDQFKVSQSRQNLNTMLKAQENAQASVIQSLEKLGKLNAKLKKIDLRSVHLGEVVALLNEVAKALTEMVNIWRELERFFATIRKHARNLKDNAQQFAAIGRKQTEVIEEGLIVEADRREMVYALVKGAQEVNAHSFMVYTMSKTYVTVAQNHLLEPLGRVTYMLTIVDDEDQVQSLRDEITNKIDESKELISQVVQNEAQKFQDRSCKVRANYDKLLEDLGGETEETREILEAGEILSNQIGEEDADSLNWGLDRK